MYNSTSNEKVSTLQKIVRATDTLVTMDLVLMSQVLIIVLSVRERENDKVAALDARYRLL